MDKFLNEDKAKELRENDLGLPPVSAGLGVAEQNEAQANQRTGKGRARLRNMAKQICVRKSASTTETILKLCRRLQSAVKLFCENLFHNEQGRIGVFSSCVIRRV